MSGQPVDDQSRPLPAHEALPPGSVLNGRYRVVRVLGTGAFGRVYLTVDEEEPGHPPIAVKELLSREYGSSDDQHDAIVWFKREVSILLTLDHSGIPAIHGYWTASRTAGPLYLAMDYVPGKTLADLQVLAGGRIPWPQVVSWGIDLCDVLAYLHSRVPPFVFRDLKPSNVLVDARTGTPVLIDFGLARQLVSWNATAIGTWGYVPFEQVLGKAEPRSDLYALAAVMHELLTNRHPTAEYRQLLREGLDVEGALRRLFPSLDSLLADAPTDLVRVLLRGTAFSPEDRFPHAEAMRDALRAVQALAPAATPRRAVVAGSGILAQALRPPGDDSATPADAPPSRLSQLLKPPPPLAPATSHADSGAASPRDAHPTPTPSSSGSVAGRAPGGETVGPRASDRLAPPETPAAGPRRPGAAGPRVGDAATAHRAPQAASAEGEAAWDTTCRDDAPSPPVAPSGGDVAAAPPRPVQQEVPTRKGRWRFRVAPATSGRLKLGTLVVSVDGTGDVTSIGEALALAAPGSRIEVLPGLYREALVLDRPVEIRGMGAVDDVVVECATAACVLMHAEAATIRGVSFRCTAGLGENRYYAVNVPTGELTLEACQIRSNSLAGIAVHGQHARPIVRRCAIRNSGERGIIVYNYAAGLFEDCDVQGQTVCVRISGHAAPVLRGCRIQGGRLGGVTFVEHGNGMLDECEISANGHHGVSIRLASNPVIRRCRINGNGWSAVSVADTSGALVEGCDLTQNRRASWDIKDSARAAVIRRDNRDVG